MPSHDQTSPVGPQAGSVRRPPPSRTRSTGGGGARRPASSGRGKPTAARTSAPPSARSGTGSGGRGSGGSRGSGGRRGSGTAARSKNQRRRRRLKIAGGLAAGLMVLLGVFVGVVYASTEVPSPDSFQTKQTTIVYWADGTTEMARLGDENRTNVELEDVSEAARNAVLAAENRNFYSDPGISFTGIIRAAWNNVTGGSTQGGSTITQQYVKNAYLTADQTLSRKFQELFLSIKLDNNFTKDEILENYLNTIYFGRGAYGIESAAKTYFGVTAADLTAEQAAVLAVLIRSPSTYDPENNPEAARDRWGLVLDGMVEEDWLDAAGREAMTYPEVLPRSDSGLGLPGGPAGHVVRQALTELRAMGYTDQQLEAGGLRITTTVGRRAQRIAVESARSVMADEPGNLRKALVAVDPRTGAVRAYYGGDNGVGLDFAQALRQPGSSVKPYVLATALKQGIGVEARRDGSSPQEFPDREAPVRNSGGVSCPACTLREAITRSLNTTFYGLAYEVGPSAVAETIRAAAGLPEKWENVGNRLFEGKPTLTGQEGTTGSAIGIGEYEMRPIDQAHGFATLAAGGVERDPFFVSRVVDSAGTVLLERTSVEGEQVLSPEVASDVTYALTDVVDYSGRELYDGRDVAAKTGTQGLDDVNNSDAWIVGYTPTISTAVWVGTEAREPIINAEGGIVYGSGLPGEIWQEFMSRVLEGTEMQELPDEPLIEGDTGEGVELPPPPPPTTSAPPPPTPPSSSAPPTPVAPVDADGDGVLSDVDPDDNDPDNPNARDADGDGVPAGVDPDDNDPDNPNPRPAPGAVPPPGDGGNGGAARPSGGG